MKVGLKYSHNWGRRQLLPLASATSYAGPGPDTMFMGFGDENLLGLEWVMPNGDLIRTGSLGCGSGWFLRRGTGPRGERHYQGSQWGQRRHGRLYKMRTESSIHGPDRHRFQ